MNITKLNINLDDDNFGAVLNCAVRYCIGRQTYMPKLVIDFITPLLPYLSNKTLWCFERDLLSPTYFVDNDTNKSLWDRFRMSVYFEIEKRVEE